MRSRRPSLTRNILVFALACSIAACGGGGGSVTAPQISGPAPKTTPTATATPTAVPTFAATVLASGTTLAIAPSSAVNAIVSFGPATSGAGSIVTGTLSDFLPSNVPEPMVRTRHAVSHTPVLFVELTADNAVQFAPASRVEFNGILSGTYQLASYDTTAGWHYDIAQSTTATTTLDFDVTSAFAVSPAPFVFALTQDSGSPDFTLTPNSLYFTGTGPSNSAIVTASEPYYTGAFTATSNNAFIATVAAGPGADQFTVTPVSPGFVYVHITESHGYAVDLPVTVE